MAKGGNHRVDNNTRKSESDPNHNRKAQKLCIFHPRERKKILEIARKFSES